MMMKYGSKTNDNAGTRIDYSESSKVGTDVKSMSISLDINLILSASVELSINSRVNSQDLHEKIMLKTTLS